MTRILTYNIHQCRGTDGRLDVGRVAAVIAAQEPDIVALQEVDVGRARTGGIDQAHAIAERLDMDFHFNAAVSVEEERYGDAILTALPERLVKAGPLPGYPRLPRLEPRGALWIAVTIDGVEVQVLNTHLGLVPREQQIQASALMGPAWLCGPAHQPPLVVVGDMNAGPWSATLRTLMRGMKDARATRGRIPTFPAGLAMLQIDHVLVSPDVIVTGIHAPSDALARRASDHLPLVVDFTIGAASAYVSAAS